MSYAYKRPQTPGPSKLYGDGGRAVLSPISIQPTEAISWDCIPKLIQIASKTRQIWTWDSADSEFEGYSQEGDRGPQTTVNPNSCA